MAKQAPKLVAKTPSKPKKAAPRRRRIGITLEPGEVERLDELIKTISASEAAREFGVEVDRSLVLRIAVIRGLAVMEAGAASPRSVAIERETRPVAPKEVEKAAEKPSEAAKRGGNGHILPPEGWNQWKAGEHIPEAHTSVHEYYTTKGWQRWWGKAGEIIEVFYWTGDDRLHDVEPFAEKGPGGTTVLAQKINPYGVGHIIPHSWAVA